MDDRVADALFLLVLAVSVLVPVHMLLRNIMYGPECMVVTFLITAVVMVALYYVIRRRMTNG